MAIALVDGIPPIKQPRGRPRRRPDEVLADRAYDAEQEIRQPLRQRKAKPLIPKRNTEHGSGLGKFRYVVEAAFHCSIKGDCVCGMKNVTIFIKRS